MIISEQQFFDFMECPALFEMKNVKKIDIPEQITLSNLLDKVSNYFFINLLNGKICSGKELKKKWDSICEENRHIVDDKKIRDGIALIIKFANWAAENQVVVLDVSSRYSIVVADIEIVGNIGTVLALPNGGQELLVTSFSNKAPDQTIVDMRLKYTIEAYGFEQAYNQKIDGIRLLSVKNGKDYYTRRGEDDFRRLRIAINSIGKSIQQGLYYPRESVTCPQCPAKQYCRYWYY